MTLKRRFWSKVRIGPGCWLWTATTDQSGYGRLRVGSRKDGSRRLAGAHRLAYELVRGALPDGMQVLHRCDTPACVRPSHMFLGTQADNIRDMVKKRRQGCGGQCGEDVGNSKLTEAQVRDIRLRYAAGGVSQSELGAEYGVSQTNIGHIVRGVTWQSVQP